MKQWLTLPGSSCIESSRLFLFHVACTFSKSSFCHEQAVGQRHLCQCQCQCSRVHHTVIPSRAHDEHREIRVSASSSRNCTSGTGSLITMCLRLVTRLWSSCRRSASKCFGFALWHKEFDDFSLFYVNTLQLVPCLHSIEHYSKSLHCTMSAVDIIFSLLTFLINTYLYAPAARS